MFGYCQSVFIINNVLYDNWNIYHVCYFLRSRFPKSFFCLLAAYRFLFPFFLKKCLPFVYIMWRSWYVSNRKKINSPSKHFQRFLFFCWFLLTFCFLASQILLARSYTDISMNFIYFLCYLSFAFYIKNIKTRKRSCSSLVRPSAPRPRISAAVFYIFFLLSP